MFRKCFDGKAPSAQRRGDSGSAIVISLFVLALVSVFVAIALSRSSSAAAAIGNETAEARTFYAAQGSLETMTRNFNKVFEVKLNPTTNDLNAVRNGFVAGAAGYTYQQEVDQMTASQNVVLTGGPYSGLFAIRDNWRLRTTATDNVGVQVQLTRNILNSRVPIFQFGIFYEDDLELYRPPLFSFGGRVHSNRHFFVSPGSAGVYFNSRVTAVGHVITQSWRNGYTGDSSNDETYIKNASGVNKQLLPDRGSVLNTTSGASNNIFASNPDLPPSKINPNWSTQSSIFDGNLQAQVKPLKLPLSIGTVTDLIEMIKRGKEVAGGSGGDLENNGGTLSPVTTASTDNEILRAERFANKTGIRVSLADSKAKLPGCASGIGTAAVTGRCGIRLDGDSSGLGSNPNTSSSTLADRARGYQPKSMRSTSGGSFNYIPTRVNGERLYNSGREVWIKIETVQTNATTGMIETADITEDLLSLGMTEQPPSSIDIQTGSYNESPLTSSLTSTSAQSVSSGGTDSRSVIKIQRFAIPGPSIPGSSNVLYSYGSGSTSMNVVRRFSGVSDSEAAAGCTSGCTTRNSDPNSSLEHYAFLKRSTVNGTSNEAIVPFPIEMFDTREGEHYDEVTSTYYDDVNKVARNGVMSMIDIDIANLRRFFRGDFNGLFPTDTPFAISKSNVGLVNSDIPQKQGWVLYVSDRRGDEDFDGEFDMEDIYGSGKGNDGIMQIGEDVNGNGVLDRLYGTESEKYNTNEIAPDQAAINDHKYYRRGVRLINATVLPGIYDSSTPANTRGFTVASENGIYVQGNYNATGVASVPSTGNTPFDDYLPFNSAVHIPASIVADAVTILSNAWNDAESFSSAHDEGGRLASNTTIRFAMISGDSVSSKEATPNQGGISPRLNGGVHNFKRFLERWTGNRLDYAGSLINLYNSRNNNGSFKCCDSVYDPPNRNWVFDATFLDPSRLPPGTPFFQYVQTTGFERTNN